ELCQRGAAQHESYALAEPGRKLLSVLTLIKGALNARGFLQRMQILAENVLCDGHRPGRLVVEWLDERRDFLESGELGRSPAPLPCPDLEVALLPRVRTHHDRLEYTIAGHGACE